MPIGDSKLTKIKQRMVAIAHRVLDGRLNPFEASQMLAPLCQSFDTVENEEMITFIVVAEELDKLQKGLGIVLNWDQEKANPDVLKDLIDLYRPSIIEACQIIYKKFMTTPQRGRYSLVKIAKELLAGEIDFWDGCCWIAGARLYLDEPERDDPLLLSFLGTQSEIETYPRFEPWRSKCDPVYLAEKDRRLAEYRKSIEKSVYEDCREIIRRYDD